MWWADEETWEWEGEVKELIMANWIDPYLTRDPHP